MTGTPCTPFKDILIVLGRILFLLTIVILLHQAPSFAAHDMTGENILGVMVGMTRDNVNKVVESLQGVDEREEVKAKSSIGNRKERVRNLFLGFKDGRFFSVGYSETSEADCAADISLVYQDQSFSRDLLKKIVQRYGKPDFKYKRQELTQMVWGGKAEAEGAIIPSKGVAACSGRSRPRFRCDADRHSGTMPTGVPLASRPAFRWQADWHSGACRPLV